MSHAVRRRTGQKKPHENRGVEGRMTGGCSTSAGRIVAAWMLIERASQVKAD